MSLYLDMDEVLADFVRGAAEAHGTTYESVRAGQQPGEWNMADSMGLSHDEFWKPINAMGADFWLELEPLPWFCTLIAAAESYAPGDWFIATSPDRSTGTLSAKLEWLRKRLGQDFDRFFPTRYKWKLAKPGTVLIDDNDENVRRFREEGGQGIVFPSRGNSLHHLDHDPTNYVLKELETVYENSST